MANINIREFIDDLREELFEAGEPATTTTFDRSAILILARHLDGTTKQLELPGLTRGQKAAATREKNKKKAQRQALGSGITTPLRTSDVNAKPSADAVS